MPVRRTPPSPWARPLVLSLCLVGAPVAGALGCDDKAMSGGAGAPSASASVAGLSPELAAKVLARVGDRAITLGEFAALLERMDQFERLRYQTPERRKQLLDELIKAELLAEEARARGLDKAPETQERLRQLLRDEILREVRSKLPAPAEIPEAEVRARYEARRDDFREPERRRVAVVVLTDAAKARKVAEQARKATPAEWGKLVKDHSADAAAASGATALLELAGDLGIVSPPGDARGENTRVPEAVRAAVFKLERVGDVAAEPVEEGGKFYVVRLTGKTEARERSFAEAERTLRVALLQERLEAAEKALEAELRGRFPVKIDDAALARVTVPAPGPDPAASASAGAPGASGAAVAAPPSAAPPAGSAP